MKKMLSLFLTIAMLLNGLPALAEGSADTANMSTTSGEPPAMPDGQPPEKPDGEAPGGAPNGQPPEMPNGEAPSGMPGGQDGPGGGSSQPDSYAAATTITEDTTLLGGTYASTGTDENAVHVAAGETTIEDAQISRVSNDSTGGDSASFTAWARRC